MIQRCIYCGNVSSQLTDEHIIPFGLGGSIVLEKSSCVDCNKVTSLLEQHILRGHWLGIRRKLNTGSRRKSKGPTSLQANLLRSNGINIFGKVPIDECNFCLIFSFFRPEELDVVIESGIKPFAKSINYVVLGPGPSIFYDSNGKQIQLKPDDKIDFLISEFTASGMLRFLAKIAHSFVISERGANACAKFYLNQIILGDDKHAMRYIGNASEIAQGIQLPRVDKFHSIQIVEKGKYLTVLIQLFSLPQFNALPIYEVVVGEIH
jgi:hypothetical protein